jgi:type IV pilus assembly protein PilA
MKKESMNVEKGFTLIELMIVVVVIGVLSVIAIPIYADYVTRTQVLEAVAISAPIRKAHEEYFMEHGKWAISTIDHGGDLSWDGAFSSNSGKYVYGMFAAASPTVWGMRGGVILVYFGNNASKSIDHKSMAFVAEDNGGSISWVCKPYDDDDGPIDEKYLPKECS